MSTGNTIVDVVVFLAILLPSIILHEVAHGWVAERFGDPTARKAGRITLKPIPHIDPVGSLLLPGLLAVAGRDVFGWAKPVPVNPRFFTRPVGHMAIVALAGPATNLTIAAVLARFGPFTQVGDDVFRTADGLWVDIAIAALLVNAALAVFNMLPIPPLDGSRLLPLFIGDAGRQLYARIQPYSFILLFALLFLFPGSLSFLGDVIIWLVKVLV